MGALLHTELKQSVLNSLYVKTMGVHMLEKRAFASPWKLGLRTKTLSKTWRQLLFAAITLTLHRSQVHCSGAMQWWACSSLMSAPLPAEVSCQTCKQIVLLLVFIV